MNSALIFGCTDEATDGGETETETDGGGGLCEYDGPYVCECQVDGEWITLEEWIYIDEPTVADNECAQACSILYFPIVDSWKITPVACIDDARVIDCSTWHPDLSISHGDTWDHSYVDRKIVETLTRDPEPLRSCDDAVFVRSTSGGYVVMNSSPGELLYELGLRDGDKLKSLNGYPLDTPEDVAVAYTQLWSNNGASEFLLDLQRDHTRTQLHYTLVE